MYTIATPHTALPPEKPCTAGAKMPLENLPLEILCMIIRFVGSSQLRRQEACGLLVCKWWYNLAKPILLEDITLSGSTLIHLPQRVHEELRRFTRQITIDIQGFEDWPDKKERPHEEAEERDSQWNEALAVHLDRFGALLLPSCSHVDSFTLRARSQFDPAEPFAPRCDYLSLWSPASLVDTLQTCKISELVIDTCGSELNHSIQGHVCPHRILLIPSLRSIRLRMRRVCPQILDMQCIESTTLFDESSTSSPILPEREDPVVRPPSKIESIIINLSLKETGRFSAGYSQHCTRQRRGWDLYEDMIMAAEEVVKRAPGLKMLRFLIHKHPSLEIVAKDCITGTKMILSDDGEWDWGDEGKVDPDDEEVSDQEFSSASSDEDEDIS